MHALLVLDLASLCIPTEVRGSPDPTVESASLNSWRGRLSVKGSPQPFVGPGSLLLRPARCTFDEPHRLTRSGDGAAPPWRFQGSSSAWNWSGRHFAELPRAESDPRRAT